MSEGDYRLKLSFLNCTHWQLLRLLLVCVSACVCARGSPGGVGEGGSSISALLGLIQAELLWSSVKHQIIIFILSPFTLWTMAFPFLRHKE